MIDFEQFFLDNKSFIFRYLLRLCKNESLAEELTQETFFRAYMNVRSLRNEAAAPVWLRRIAKHAYFAWYNEHKRLRPLDAIEGNRELSAVISPDAEEALIERDLSEKALSCLNRLEEPYKEVFKLYVLGQIPLIDISRSFGKSESWARVTYYRAKQKILEMMGELK